MVKLLLVRHGNTFAPGDKVVWVGARTDLPLVPSGIVQAETLAARLKEQRIVPDRVLTGPLQRTRQHAEIAVPGKHADIRPTLREIDYGPWEAKSTEEIHDLGGRDKLEAWDRESRWPDGVGWSPSLQEIESNVAGIMAEMTDPLTVVVSSNGILRFFARQTHTEVPTSELKVGTGNACLLEKASDGWKIVYWNRKPADVTV